MAPLEITVHGTPRVLLVNDNEDGIFLLERAARKEFPDAMCFKCAGAAAALRLLETETVDAIITDNRMPEVTGIVMVREIRRRDAVTPILMLTGSSEIETDAIAAGVTLFFAGGNWDDIRLKIRELLSRFLR